MRTILKMHLSLIQDLPELKNKFKITNFVESDAPEWLTLNNAIFINHPDQGDWLMADLSNRIAEKWFDPTGFFLARIEGRIVGYCWTKIHNDRVNEGPIGEIYVLGIDPNTHGTGLGRELTLISLQYFKAKGIKESMLYVDADNHAALILYKKLGFH